MPPVILSKGTTALLTVCNQNGRFAEADQLSVFDFLKSYLIETEWDARIKRNIQKYHYYKYNRATGMLHLPVHVLPWLESYLERNGVSYVIEPIPVSESIDINIDDTGSFTDRSYQSAAIEFLTDSRRPMRALDLQTGCLVGDSVIDFNRAKKGFRLSISEAYEHFHNTGSLSARDWDRSIPTFVRSFTGKRIQLHEIDDIMYSGVRPVYLVTLSNGLSIECTADHQIMTKWGMVRADCIVGKEVMCDSANSKKSGRAYKRVIDHYLAVSSDMYSRFNQGVPEFSTAVSFEYVGDKSTYDICCKEPHHNFVANEIVVSNSGKTYIAIRTISELKKRALVVVPASLIQQWYDALNSMVIANVDVIRGNKPIHQIVEANYDIDSDIILASVNTLSEFASGAGVYNVGPTITEFLRKLRIGVKVVDECHLNFFANTMIDIQANVEHNLYLSATHMRSAKSSNRIFKLVFPEEIRRDGDEYNRYVNITECRFSVGPINQKLVITSRGWAQFKYEKLMFKDYKRISSFFDRILFRIVEEKYISVRRDGQKMLMIVGLRDFAEFLVIWFTNTYPDLKSIAFLHETPEEEIDAADIIVSTIGSAGTGRDIKNLRTMLLFSSFSSEALTTQTLGRLRKLPNGDTPEFVYFVNTSLLPCIRHADNRRPIYRLLGKKFDIANY